MSLLVTGSIGIDTVTTPCEVSKNCIGGSSVYFSMAASFFGPVRFVGVVGADCPFDLAQVFNGRPVDLAGLEVRRHSKTFRWWATYKDDMDHRTDRVKLGVLAEAPPKVPEAFKDSQLVFLANKTPALQMQLLDEIEKPLFVAADTMPRWIKGNRNELSELLKRIDCLIINVEEARLLVKQSNLVRAAEQILELGPSIVIVKKGESGSLMCLKDGNKFVLPAYMTTDVKDPTGAGDSFAGGFMGYLAQARKTDFDTLKTAVAYGTVVASFTIADFSLSGLTSVTRGDIDIRLGMLRKFTHF
ncbi:MAG: PfkB family carbohydrate kinase [Phycisphaerae bacterium]|nr:PfkB family carbohydrate kinase [Phycisphaerae bacterium]